MDECANVLAWPASNVAYTPDEFETLMRLHVNHIAKLFKEKSSVIASSALRLLDILDPALNSYSYLALLDAIIPSNFEALPQIDRVVVEQVVNFLLSFDARQVRFAGSNFSSLLGKVSTGRLMPPATAVRVLASAFLRLDPTGSMLTSNHLPFVKLAYHTDNVAAALPVITKNILFYPGMSNQKEPQRLSDLTLTPPAYISKETGLTYLLRPSEILEYDYVLGLMFCSLRDWSSALSAFARATSYPSRDNGASKIAAESHKRWILVSLLLNGKTTSSVPPHTTNAVARNFNTINKPYLAIADCFNTMSASQLKHEVETSQTTWTDDKTEGLMREVVQAHQQWQIVQLRDVYAKVSISNIRQLTWSAEHGDHLSSDDEVQQLVGGMITSGMVKAAIRKPAEGPAYLEFFGDDDLSEAEYAAQLGQAAKRIGAMQPVLRATKERMATHRDHIKHLQKEQKRGDNERMDAGFEESIEDEDLMTGISMNPMVG